MAAEAATREREGELNVRELGRSPHQFKDHFMPVFRTLNASKIRPFPVPFPFISVGISNYLRLLHRYLSRNTGVISRGLGQFEDRLQKDRN